MPAHPLLSRFQEETIVRTVFIVLLFTSSIPSGFGGLFDLRQADVDLLVSGGSSPLTKHGRDVFRSAELEATGEWPRLERLVPGAMAGAAITYNAVRQARSWFGYQFGDPDDRVTAVSSFFFARRAWLGESSRVRPYMEVGIGPMWSNRRVPAATSRLNFESRFGVGSTLRGGRSPIYFGYRFEHISNGGIVSRNPGVNLHSLVLGRRLMTVRR
jgi:hypothetical protein